MIARYYTWRLNRLKRKLGLTGIFEFEIWMTKYETWSWQVFYTEDNLREVVVAATRPKPHCMFKSTARNQALWETIRILKRDYIREHSSLEFKI